MGMDTPVAMVGAMAVDGVILVMDMVTVMVMVMVGDIRDGATTHLTTLPITHLIMADTPTVNVMHIIPGAIHG